LFARAQKWHEFENWPGGRRLIRAAFAVSGLHARAKRNARDIVLRHNRLAVAGLPPAFEGYTILHLSDLHIDLARDIPHELATRVRGLRYDACALTGDFRAETGGDFEATLAGMRVLARELSPPVFGVFGNHDSLLMLQPLEELGVHMLVNEHVRLERDGAELYLAGVDDPNFFRAHDLTAARRGIPEDAASVLLAHSPEIYAEAAESGFGALLCGHTHGGQLCLPGGVPVRRVAGCPRSLHAGAWEHGGMSGYTSVGSGSCVVDLRLNCPPEVTLQRLTAG